jgi:membrane protein YdbS with pleckstrin-like domain
MTNSPESPAEKTPDSPLITTEGFAQPAVSAARSDAPSVSIDPADTEEPGVAADVDVDVLDRDTYATIREPRSPARLPLGDGTWHQLARQYVWVQLISTGVLVLMVLAAVLVVTLLWGQWWAWIPGGIFLAILIWTMIITPRQARAYGYQLRRDDLVFRRGILWQRVVAVPYGRMQLIDITHGPLDRGFGIAQLKLVTAAASTGVVIPGLTQQAAEQLRDTLVDVAEARRTGL